jgi:hypothetical protein
MLVLSRAGGLSVTFISTAGRDPAESAGLQSAVEEEPFSHRVDPLPKYPWVRTPARLRSLGFQTTLDSWAKLRRPVWRFVVPYWFLAVTGAGLPAIRIASTAWRERRWRLRTGLCAACGYDLRATPNRCPECGEAASLSRLQTRQ